MTRRFTTAVGSYIILGLIACAAIVLRGDGPHPTVLAVYPFKGDHYWPGGTAQIVFSQPMDQATVERGLKVSPGSQGQGTWYGNTLNLQPVGDWHPEVTYHIALIGKIADEVGRPLQTPFTFQFRVHHIRGLRLCRFHGVPNVCERTGRTVHLLTRSVEAIRQYALSSDGSTLAYIRRDASGLPHLFLSGVDGTGMIQVTHGRTYADSAPFWAIGQTNSVSYYRQRATPHGSGYRLGKKTVWNVSVDGSNNAQL